jgi:hypothetical protein
VGTDVYINSSVYRHVYRGNRDKKFGQTKNDDIPFVLNDVWVYALYRPTLGVTNTNHTTIKLPSYSYRHLNKLFRAANAALPR